MFGKSKRKTEINKTEVKDKRVKTNDTQEKQGKIINTLFNYFTSAKSNEEITPSSSIKSEIVVKETIDKVDCDILFVETEKREKVKEECKVNNVSSSANESKQAWLKIFEKSEAKPEKVKTETVSAIQSLDENKTQNYDRKCPFYKFITSWLLQLKFKKILNFCL